MLFHIYNIVFLAAAFAQAAPQRQGGALRQQAPPLPDVQPYPCSGVYYVGKHGGTRVQKNGLCNIPTQGLPQPCFGRFKTPGNPGDCPDSKNIFSPMKTVC